MDRIPLPRKLVVTTRLCPRARLQGLALSGLLAIACLAHAEDAPRLSAAPKLPDPLTHDAIRELVARLSDAEVRQLLIAQLDRAAAPARAAGAGDMMGMVEGMEGRSHRLRARAAELTAGAAALPAALGDARSRFLEGRGAGHLLLVVLGFAVMLAASVLAERIFRWAIRHADHAIDVSCGAGLAVAAGNLALRLAFELLALLSFTAGALICFLAVYQGHRPSRQLLLTLLAAVVLVRLVAVIARVLLAPAQPGRRLLPFGAAAARRLYRGVVGLAALYAFGAGTLHLLRGLGVPDPTVDVLMLVLGTAFLALALATIWGIRTDVALLILGRPAEGATPGRRLAARVWPVLATVYLVLVYAIRSLEIVDGTSASSTAPILSVVFLVGLPLIDMALCRVLAALLRERSEGTGMPDARATFEPVLRRAIHVVVIIGGLLALAELWDLDVFSLAERGLGGRISGALLGIAITLLLAWTVWELARTAIDRRMAAEAGAGVAEPGVEGGDRPASRLRTLLPLLRMLLLGALVVMATLSVMAALGVNILPLLAGAGVVGLAIGFGSQTLVRDIVSGAFFLMDDAFRLGEYIEAGDSKGTVEKIGIRSMQVRHHRGALNIVPYGEITRLRNTSRDWMILTIQFALAYDTDLVKVKKVIKRIGEEIAADPELGADLLQPLKSQGVTATDDAGLVVRAKFMAKPGSAPFLIRREAYSRILKAFAAEGVRFASRQVMVSSAPGTGATAAAGAAALAADGRRDG